MPLVMFLPFVPLVTVLTSIFVITSVKCNDFECADLVQDSDMCWCYEEGGFGCLCCTVCHDDHDDDHDYAHVNCYDDSSDSFHAYAKKS